MRYLAIVYFTSMNAWAEAAEPVKDSFFWAVAKEWGWVVVLVPAVVLLKRFLVRLERLDREATNVKREE